MQGYWLNTGKNDESEIPETTGVYGMPNHEYYLRFNSSGSGVIPAELSPETLPTEYWILPDYSVITGTYNMIIYASWVDIVLQSPITYEEAHNIYYDELVAQLKDIESLGVMKFNRHYMTGKTGITRHSRDGLANLFEHGQPTVNLQPPFEGFLGTTDGYFQVTFYPYALPDHDANPTIKYTTGSKIYDNLGGNDGTTDRVHYTVMRLTII